MKFVRNVQQDKFAQLLRILVKAVEDGPGELSAPAVAVLTAAVSKITREDFDELKILELVATRLGD